MNFFKIESREVTEMLAPPLTLNIAEEKRGHSRQQQGLTIAEADVLAMAWWRRDPRRRRYRAQLLHGERSGEEDIKGREPRDEGVHRGAVVQSINHQRRR
jgi:hypothetical protein